MIKESHRRSHAYCRAAQWCIMGVVAFLIAFAIAGPPLQCSALAAADSQSEQPRLNKPKGVVADRAGNLYVTDSGNGRVLYYPQQGQSRLVLDRLKQPTGLALDEVRSLLYIAETGNNRILCIALASGATSIIVAGILNQPAGLAVDVFSNLFIADTGNDRVLRRTAGGAICTVRTDPYSLSRPKGVATVLGDLFIADTGNNRLLRRSSGCDASPVTVIETVPLNQPADLTAGPFGLYIADTCNNRVLQIDLTSTTTLIAGAGPAGCGNGGFCGDGGLATQACLNAPEGLCVYVNQLFIADTGNNRIRQVDPASGIITTVNWP
jgi:DNA-binding beta-propeller fold protein YncE